MCVCVCVCVSRKVKMETVVEGDLMAFFSLATSSRCRRVCYSISWISPLYL